MGEGVVFVAIEVAPVRLEGTQLHGFGVEYEDVAVRVGAGVSHPAEELGSGFLRPQAQRGERGQQPFPCFPPGGHGPGGKSGRQEIVGDRERVVRGGVLLVGVDLHLAEARLGRVARACGQHERNGQQKRGA